MNVSANDNSLKLYGAPRSCLCVAMVTRYFCYAVHFKEFLERTCQTMMKFYSVKKNEAIGCKIKILQQKST